MDMQTIEKSKLLMLDTAIRHLERTVGTPCQILRDTSVTKAGTLEGDANDVYGSYAGADTKDLEPQTQVVDDVKLLLTGQHFSSFNEGGFDMLFADELELYTSHSQITPNDVLTVARPDGKINGFKVISEDSLGITLSILKRYTISPIMLPSR